MAIRVSTFASDDRLRSLLGRISRLRASSSDASAGAVQIAREVLDSLHGRAVVMSIRPDRVHGRRHVTTITRDQELNGAPAVEAARAAGNAAALAVPGPLVDGGRAIGSVHLYLQALPPRNEPIAPLVRYMGQQIGGLIAIARLEDENRKLAEHVASFRDEIASRKVTNRAIAILAKQDGIGPAEAHRRLEQHSQRLGKPVGEIAAAVVTAAKLGLPEPDSLARRPEPN